jgi:uncharacterized protein (DUF433 family)
MTTDQNVDFLGKGVYPLPQAARLVGADSASVRRWMLGYQRKGKGYGPLWVGELNDTALNTPSVSFRDLLELRMVAAFAKHGVATSVIRKTIDTARQDFGSDFPLSTKRFLTDGKKIFLEAIDAGGTDGETMVDVVRRQFVFSSIIRPSILGSVEFDGETPRRWFPLGTRRRQVLLDPEIQFGAPIVAGAGIPTDTIAAAYVAEGMDSRAVGRIFDIEPRLVDAAVAFEKQLLAA